LLTRQELEEKLQLDLTQPTTLIAYHPVTILRDTTSEADALFEALGCLPSQLVFCYPNADAGSRALIDRTEAFLRTRNNGRLFINLPAVTYWSLLQHVKLMIGNSSSGIMETGSFALPTVNVGLRQQGRERPANVLDALPTKESILNKINEAHSASFLQSIDGMTNPYGDGHAAERIVKVLTNLPPSEELLMKRGGR
jgi:UDP-N-acetylglucosamine 2-epimerase (non-hydrolysing)/GDP/UDP-N,N'-diacetylbacillosamine 2-epimerase (hydrolysing)